jgi:hypothetical protein
VSETEYEEMEFDLGTPDPAVQSVDEQPNTEDEEVEGDACAEDDEASACELDKHPEDTDTIRVIVACTDAEGEPDFAFVKIRCTPQQQEADEHCLTAQDWAADNDYDGPFVVFDEHNVAGKQLLEFFQWDSAPVVDIAKR